MFLLADGVGDIDAEAHEHEQYHDDDLRLSHNQKEREDLDEYACFLQNAYHKRGRDMRRIVDSRHQMRRYILQPDLQKTATEIHQIIQQTLRPKTPYLLDVDAT